jgi:hypothetical protein
MTSHIQYSYHFPFIQNDQIIPASHEELANMQRYTQITRDEMPELFDHVKKTVLKASPVALSIIAGLALAPFWITASMISSLLFGSLSWVIPAVGGAMLYSECCRTVESFDKGCTPIVDYYIAKLAQVRLHISKEFSTLLPQRQ